MMASSSFRTEPICAIVKIEIRQGLSIARQTLRLQNFVKHKSGPINLIHTMIMVIKPKMAKNGCFL